MALNLTGIENVEFYSGHYLDSVLEGDLKGLFDTWKKAEDADGTRPPYKGMAGPGAAWEKARRSAAGEPDAGGDRAGVGVEAAEGWQQRRMNVDQAVAPIVKECLGDQAHESGQAGELGARRADRCAERLVERLARWKIVMIDDDRLDTRGARAIETGGVGVVRDDDDYLGRKVGRRTGVD